MPAENAPPVFPALRFLLDPVSLLTFPGIRRPAALKPLVRRCRPRAAETSQGDDMRRGIRLEEPGYG